MKKKFRYALLAVIVAVVLLAIVRSCASPVLYSLEKDTFPSRFHDNAEALRQQSINSSIDVAPDLQHLIDFSGPISLNIRIHNIDQARRDFERFSKTRGTIKNLIVKLDMSESEIQELERDTEFQRQILDSLFNTTVSLDALQSLEVQYHDQGNTDMLTTIRLQGNELRSKVKGLSAKYRNTTESVIANGKKLGLNTTKAEESQRYVEEIVRNIEQPSPTTQIAVDTSLIPGDERISLFIRPNIGRYRDIIEYQGISLTLIGNQTIRAAGSTIVIYSQEIPVGRTTTDAFGYYNVKIPIERAEIGPNTVYATAPSSRSVNRTLTVIPVNSSTSLAATKLDNAGNIMCNGSVMANVPVRSASVHITWDESNTVVIKTDASGRFQKAIKLPPGKHTVIARFSGDDYPIYPSESDPVIVDIPLIPGVDVDARVIPLTAISIIVILLFLGAGYYYYKRIFKQKTHILDRVRRFLPGSQPKTVTPAPGIDDLMEERTGDLLSDNDGPMDETFIMYYARILKENGLSAASRIVYQQIAGRVARDLRIRRHQALTPREMARDCKGRPYCGTFARFTAAYERVRYGGTSSVKDQTVFETAMEVADEQIGGEDH
jgi:hypothetical protein